MNKLRIILTVCAVILFCSCSKKPDVLYVNGKFYTLDNNNSVVEAVAVRKGQILELGKSTELKEKYSSVKVIDLNGKTVVPGFIDSEGNLMEFSKQLSLLDLRSANSLDEIKKLLRERIKTAKESEWIGGFGWDDLKLTDKELQHLDKSILDSISTKHFIYLVNSYGNTTWVNSALLAATKVTKDTPDPEEGEIGVNEKDEPSGLFYDDAQEFVIKILPQPTEQQVMDNLENGMNELFRYGITEVCDVNITEDGLNVYKKMVDANKFRIRLYVMIPAKSPLAEKYFNSGPENYKDRISVKCMHLEYDGYFSTQDAAMENDYKEEPKRKTPYNDAFDIMEMTRKAYEKGFQISVKAIGDRAITATLNAIDSVMKSSSKKTGRNRIEYLEFVNPNNMQRLKSLDIIPSFRPEVTLEDKVVAGEIISSEIIKSLGMWSSALRQTGMISCGSDFPYHTISPLIQMYYLATGMTLDSAANKIANNSAQKISVLEALKSYTTWAAYSIFAEETKGTLEKGKFADFVVLSDDILSSDPQILLRTKIMMTIVNGEIVFENKLISSLP